MGIPTTNIVSLIGRKNYCSFFMPFLSHPFFAAMITNKRVDRLSILAGVCVLIVNAFQ